MDIRSIVALLFSILSAFFYGWSSGLDNTGRAIEYVYYTDKRSWNEARNVCHSIGGELAKVDSQQTIDDIKQLALDKYPGDNFLSQDFWIGLYDTELGQRREFALDCSELTFTSNYVETYHDNELCFKLRAGSGWEGNSRPCDEDSHFLCEIHPEGTCSFRYEIQDVSAAGVSGVNNYGVCEDHCAYDVTCSGALYVSPSVCYKLPYNTSNTTAPALATISSKFCASFLKNETIVSPWENRLKYPVDPCGIIPTSGPPVSNVSELSPSIYPTSSIAPSSSVMIEPCSTLVMTQLVTSVVTAIETQMTTLEPSATSCTCTVSPDISTVVLTRTATELELTTVEVVQQCTTQTLISPVTVQVTATPSCSLPVVSVTPSITTPVPPNITVEEAEKIAEELSRNLTVDVKKTSAYLRSLISVADNRKTSQAMGSVGVACIVVPLVIIISSDIKLIYISIRDLLS